MPDPIDDPTKAPDFGIGRSTRRQLQRATKKLASEVNRLSKKLAKAPKGKGSSADVDKATKKAANDVIGDMNGLRQSVASLLKKLRKK